MPLAVEQYIKTRNGTSHKLSETQKHFNIRRKVKVTLNGFVPSPEC